MTKSQLLLREGVALTRGASESAQSTRVLRGDELDLVSGGIELENCLISNVVAPRNMPVGSVAGLYHC